MKEIPATVKRSIELVGLCALAYVVSNSRDIVTPILMAFFLSILLQPIYRRLCRWRVPEVLAILLSIVSAALVLTGIGWFFSQQMINLLSDFPTIQQNLNGHLHNVSAWINDKTDFSSKQQLDWLRAQSELLVGNAGTYLSGAAVTLTGVFVFVGLLPIYTFLIMYYKNLLLKFVFLWFKPNLHPTVRTTLVEAESIIMSYLVGLMIQITYITILLGGLLAILDVKFALLIGVIFAILNLIPYVGALVGNLIGVLLTLTTSQDLMPIFIVLGSIAAVQFLDNNILMPRIVGSKVKLNALASIFGVIIGGSLAGVSGMFLSLPVMAILKIIFDNSETFRQWGVLLGDENPENSPMVQHVEQEQDNGGSAG